MTAYRFVSDACRSIPAASKHRQFSSEQVDLSKNTTHQIVVPRMFDVRRCPGKLQVSVSPWQLFLFRCYKCGETGWDHSLTSRTLASESHPPPEVRAGSGQWSQFCTLQLWGTKWGLASEVRVVRKLPAFNEVYLRLAASAVLISVAKSRSELRLIRGLSASMRTLFWTVVAPALHQVA